MRKMARRSGPTHVKVTLLVPVGLWKALAGAAAAAGISRAEFARRGLAAAARNPQIHAPAGFRSSAPGGANGHRVDAPISHAHAPTSSLADEERRAAMNSIWRNAGMAELTLAEFLKFEAQERRNREAAEAEDRRKAVAGDGESGVEGE